jgi:hypothetical protein
MSDDQDFRSTVEYRCGTIEFDVRMGNACFWAADVAPCRNAAPDALRRALREANTICFAALRNQRYHFNYKLRWSQGIKLYWLDGDVPPLLTVISLKLDGTVGRSQVLLVKMIPLQLLEGGVGGKKQISDLNEVAAATRLEFNPMIASTCARR